MTAIENASSIGDLRLALTGFAHLQRIGLSNSLLDVRLGATVLPLLRVAGERAAAAALAESAAAAAVRIARRELAVSFLTQLSRIRRSLGDHYGAYDAAVRARRLVLDDQSPEYREATLEAARALFATGDNARATELVAPSRGVGGADDESTRLLLEEAAAELRLAGQSGSPSAQTDVAAHTTAPAPTQPDTIGTLIIDGLRLERGGAKKAALTRFVAALDAMERLRESAGPGVLRAALINDAWHQASRSALGLALEEGSFELALDVLEGGRRTSSGRGRAIEWPVRLEPRVAIVVYSIVPSGVYAIIVTDAGISGHVLPTTGELIGSRVALWRALAETGENQSVWSAVGRQLADDIIVPIIRHPKVRDAAQIYVVPDGALHLLPFAGLLASTDVPLAVSQVGSLSQLREAMETPVRPGEVVAFGPAGGADTVQELSLTSGQVFLGRQATETALRDAVSSAAVFHFAGHAVDSDEAGRSRLGFRGDSLSDGALTLQEIVGLDLTGATVVLLACDTATRTRTPDGHGYFSQQPSLGEAFMLAGARAVVGNLWPITEEDGRMLAAEFYAAGGPSLGARALERARSVLRQRYPEIPRRWAGAVWLGAAGPWERLPER